MPNGPFAMLFPERVRSAALGVRDPVAGHAEYAIYKQLISVQGIFGTWEMLRPSDASWEYSGQWFRSYGNENWEFSQAGLMRLRHASINDLVIGEDERLFHWSLGARPAQHPGLSSLGL